MTSTAAQPEVTSPTATASRRQKLRPLMLILWGLVLPCAAAVRYAEEEIVNKTHPIQNFPMQSPAELAFVRLGKGRIHDRILEFSVNENGTMVVSAAFKFIKQRLHLQLTSHGEKEKTVVHKPIPVPAFIKLTTLRLSYSIGLFNVSVFDESKQDWKTYSGQDVPTRGHGSLSLSIQSFPHKEEFLFFLPRPSEDSNPPECSEPQTAAVGTGGYLALWVTIVSLALLTVIQAAYLLFPRCFSRSKPGGEPRAPQGAKTSSSGPTTSGNATGERNCRKQRSWEMQQEGNEYEELEEQKPTQEEEEEHVYEELEPVRKPTQEEEEERVRRAKTRRRPCEHSESVVGES